jgi:hypothetical protein
MKSKATSKQYTTLHKEHKSISNNDILNYISTEIRTRGKSIDNKVTSKNMSISKEKELINLRGMKDKTRSFDLSNSIMLAKSTYLNTQINKDGKRMDTEERRKTTNGSYTSIINREELDLKRYSSNLTVESPLKNKEYLPSSPSKLYSNSTFAKYLNNIAPKRDSFKSPTNSTSLFNTMGNKSNLNTLLYKNKSKIFEKLMTKQTAQVSEKPSSKTVVNNSPTKTKERLDNPISTIEVDTRIKVMIF